MWFTETPWPPILICCVVGVLLFAGWFATRRGLYLMSVVGMIVLSGAIFLTERAIITDSEQVEAAVVDVCRAYEEDDTQRVLDHFSPQATVLRIMVAAAIKVFDVEDDLRITDLHVTMESGNTRAVSHFRANATVSVSGQGDIGRHPSRWEFTWQKEGDQWRIIEIRQLNVVNGEETNLIKSRLPQGH